MDDDKKGNGNDLDFDDFDESDMSAKQEDKGSKADHTSSFYNDMPEDVANYLNDTHPLKKRTSEERKVVTREREIRRSGQSDERHYDAPPKKASSASGRGTTLQGLLSNSHFMSRVAVILAILLALLLILFLTLQNNSLRKQLTEKNDSNDKLNELVLLNNDLRTSKSALLREIESLRAESDIASSNNKDDISTSSPPDEPDEPDTPTTTESQEILTETTYTVVKGDSLSKISQKFYKSVAYVDKLKEANNLKNPNAISVGMVLKIPPLE